MFRKTTVFLTAMLWIFGAMTALAAEDGKEKSELPEHRVVAMYFHRTERCPNCRKAGDYTKKAIEEGMARRAASKEVMLFFIDFQDKKNAKLTKGYKISGPSLVIADVHDNKVTSWKTLPKLFALVGDEAKLAKYVQANIRAYLEKE
jgi:hypothetical protein